MIGLFAGSSSLSAGTLLRAVFPTTSCVYWFCSCYFILYLAIPLLNKIIASLTRAQHRLYADRALSPIQPMADRPASGRHVAGGENGYSYVWFFRSLFYSSIPFHLSGADILCPLPEPLFRLFPAFCSGADLCLRDRSTDGTGRNARHTRRIPVSDRVFRIHLLLFVLPEYQNQGNRPKKIILAIAPLSFGVYLLHDSDFIRAFLWEKIALSRFGSLPASLGYLAIVTVCITCAGYLVDTLYQKNYRLVFRKKAEGKVDEITERIIEASKKASEAFTRSTFQSGSH